MNKKEILLLTWKLYIPTISIGSVTLICIIGSNLLSYKNQKTLIGAYTLLDKTYNDYRNKLIELQGDEIDKNIIDSISIEKAEDTYISSQCYIKSCNLIPNSSNVKTVLFYDAFSERYFETSLEQVLNAEYHINRNFALRGYSLLNEFYDFLGISHVEMGDDLGWAPTDEGIYWIDFNHLESYTKDGTPYIIIEMIFEPRLNYDDYY